MYQVNVHSKNPDNEQKSSIQRLGHFSSLSDPKKTISWNASKNVMVSSRKSKSYREKKHIWGVCGAAVCTQCCKNLKKVHFGEFAMHVCLKSLNQHYLLYFGGNSTSLFWIVNLSILQAENEFKRIWMSFHKFERVSMSLNKFEHVYFFQFRFQKMKI